MAAREKARSPRAIHSRVRQRRATGLVPVIGIRIVIGLQTWIDGLAFESQHTKDAFVNTPQGFSTNKALKRLDAESEFTESQ